MSITCAAAVAIAYETHRRSAGPRSLPAVAARSALRAEALGCWALYGADGRPAPFTLFLAPAVARLDSTRGSLPSTQLTSRDAFRVDSRDQRLAHRYNGREQAHWSADSLSDSIRIGFSNGHSGSRLVLALPAGAATADTLRGRAYEHWDFGPPWYTFHRSAYAVRQPCAAEQDT